MTAPWETPSTGAAAALVDRLTDALPVLRTARLRLRAPRLGDFPVYAAIICSPEGAYIGGPVAPEDAWTDFCQMAAGWLLRGFGLFAVERLSDGAVLGLMPFNHEYGDPEPEIGWFLAPEHRGQGYATEAAAAIAVHAETLFGPGRVVSYVAQDNAASAAVARRLGARRDAAAEAALKHDVQVWRHAPAAAPVAPEARP